MPKKNVNISAMFANSLMIIQIRIYIIAKTVESVELEKESILIFFIVRNAICV